MATSSTLSVYDYIVIASTLAVPLAIGVYVAVRGRQNNTKEEYLLGGRRLHVFPVTLSLFVTFMSSTSLIGMPAETFTTGSDFTFLAAGMMLCYLVTIFTVVPVMHTLQVTSMYEYFQLRFGSPTLRLLVTLVGMVQKIMLAAIVLLSPALSIQTATGLPFWVSVVIVGLVGIIYTSITVDGAGGLEATWELANEGGRIAPLNVYAWNIPILGVYMVCVCSMGVVAYSYLAAKGCDPFQTGILTDRNQLMPFVVLEVFKGVPGMAGLYLATIFSSALRNEVNAQYRGAHQSRTHDSAGRLAFYQYQVEEDMKNHVTYVRD
ncbi:sodium-coupled monocarboxylate transporter 2-like [Haliotis rubra]|uniref:sodium-coupled monocarboxylate transporter 2-like n=1 Tax=Haliotis rubra TaxID=36100 RepID=UPI001EE5F4AB|nr:sodium-coupled monocarboxylate transporter 2-like [Haliotis rubra]